MSLRSGVSGKVTQSGKGSYQPSLGGSKNLATENKAGAKNDKKKGTATITLEELDRIRAQVLHTKEDDYEMQRTAQRKTLQETSKNRVKNWPNTMEATRLKREEDRIKRLEDEEVSSGLIQMPL